MSDLEIIIANEISYGIENHIFCFFCAEEISECKCDDEDDPNENEDYIYHEAS